MKIIIAHLGFSLEGLHVKHLSLKGKLTSSVYALGPLLSQGRSKIVSAEVN
jgi:hypothetical protein